MTLYNQADRWNAARAWRQPEAEIIDRDTRRQVRDTTEVPYRYICSIEFLHPTHGIFVIGSGTLIGPRSVLTAAHNLFDLDSRVLTPGFLRVIPGRNGDKQPFGASFARRLIPNPSYAYAPSGTQTVEMAERDYGIIQLRSPLGTRVGYWGQQPRPAFEPRGTSIGDGSFPTRSAILGVNLSGYPGDKPSEPSFRCRAPDAPPATCSINTSATSPPHRLCGTFQWRSFDEGIRVEPRLLEYLNDSCKGHSGAPVWIKRSRWTGASLSVFMLRPANSTQRCASRPLSPRLSPNTEFKDAASSSPSKPSTAHICGDRLHAPAPSALHPRIARICADSLG